MKSWKRTLPWPLLSWLVVATGLGALWLAGQLVEPAVIGSLVIEWYNFLNNLYLAVGLPLNDRAAALNIPLLTALVLGIVGALSPCQLSTGAAALAYFAPRATQGKTFTLSIAAYIAGKILVYSLFGAAVLLIGLRANDSIPVIQAVRKVLGPVMVLLALHFFGLLPFQFALGQRLSLWLEDRFAGSGIGGAFALGVAFSLAFCPTLFLLFFGLTLPLALTQPLGAFYPGLFALGTTVPLVVVATALGTGMDAAGGTVRRAARLDKRIRLAAGVVLLMTGLNDTVIYWLV